jgi:hypothetical protein
MKYEYTRLLHVRFYIALEVLITHNISGTSDIVS